VTRMLESWHWASRNRQQVARFLQLPTRELNRREARNKQVPMLCKTAGTMLLKKIISNC